MTRTELLLRAKRRIDALTGDRLVAADHYLAYLEQLDSDEATQELLAVPGLLGRLEAAEAQIAAGDTVSVDELQRKP